MRRATVGISLLCFATVLGVTAEETFINTRSFTADGDVVIQGAVDAVKQTPQDAVDMVGDAVKFVIDDTTLAVKNIVDSVKPDPQDPVEKKAMLGVGEAWTCPMKEIVFRSYRVSEAVGLELAPDVTSGVVDVSGYFSHIDFPEGTSVYYRPDFQRLFVRHSLESMLDIEDVVADLHNATRDLMGHQIEIETQFVEVNQKTLDELGFRWNFSGKVDSAGNVGPLRLLDNNLTLPAGSDLFSQALRTGAVAMGTGNPEAAVLNITRQDSQFRWDLMISALEQTDDTNVLSAPRIVTRDGRTASIQVGEEEMLPRSFQARSVNTSIFVEHRDWEHQIMGVILEVTPELREGGLIDLELAPKVIDILGYSDYQISPDARLFTIVNGRLDTSMKRGRFPVVTRTIDGAANSVSKLYGQVLKAAYGNPQDDPDDYDPNIWHNSWENTRMWSDEELIPVPRLVGQMPYYRLREMNTRVTVADASTVGMGGLIYDKLETFRDRVPVLGSIPLIGRLFRSEGQRNIKRNLMIFVTATEVDVNGRRSADRQDVAVQTHL